MLSSCEKALPALAALAQVRVVDPAGRGRRHELFRDRSTDPKRQFAAAYYGPLIDLLEEDSTAVRADDIEVVHELPLADAAVGMSRRRFESIRAYIRGESDDARLEEESASERRPGNDRLRHVGSDGITVELGDSWDAEQMSIPPRERTQR